MSRKNVPENMTAGDMFAFYHSSPVHGTVCDAYSADPTCQRCVCEVLWLAALPLAIDDVEVDLDRLTDGRVSIGGHLHKQHAL